MSTAALASFLLAVALAFVVPGPDFAIILRYAAQARSAGRAAAVGVIGGLCVHMSAAAFGLSSLLVRSAEAFMAVKLIGAGYLFVLGVQALLASRRASYPTVSEKAAAAGGAAAVDASSLDLRRALVQGFLTNVLNPKAALFFLSLLPQFVDPSESALDQTLLLGALTVAFGVAWWMLLVTMVARVRTTWAKPAVRRTLNRVTGVVFLALGVRLLRTPA